MRYSNCVDFSPGERWWRHACWSAACITSTRKGSVSPRVIPKSGGPKTRGAWVQTIQRIGFPGSKRIYRHQTRYFYSNTIAPPNIHPRFLYKKRRKENWSWVACILSTGIWTRSIFVNVCGLVLDVKYTACPSYHSIQKLHFVEEELKAGCGGICVPVGNDACDSIMKLCVKPREIDWQINNVIQYCNKINYIYINIKCLLYIIFKLGWNENPFPCV